MSQPLYKTWTRKSSNTLYGSLLFRLLQSFHPPDLNYWIIVISWHEEKVPINVSSFSQDEIMKGWILSYWGGGTSGQFVSIDLFSTCGFSAVSIRQSLVLRKETTIHRTPLLIFYLLSFLTSSTCLSSTNHRNVEKLMIEVDEGRSKDGAQYNLHILKVIV